MTAFSRLSLCNCLTVRMEKNAKRRKIVMPVRTYTAHLMTLDLFLHKASPGATLQIPYPELWPKGFITTYRIPQEIQTFLFSPFNEIHHPTYLFDNDPDRIPYVIPMAPDGIISKKFVRLNAHTIKEPRILPRKFVEKLKEVDRKVSTLWKDPLKVLVFYDYSLAPKATQKRAMLFHKLAREAVDWPLIQIRETATRNVKDPNVWPHYSGKTYVSLLRTIERMENAKK